MTPANHVNFEAKKLFGSVGQIMDGTIPHSVWSNQDDETVMVGISVR